MTREEAEGLVKALEDFIEAKAIACVAVGENGPVGFTPAIASFVVETKVRLLRALQRVTGKWTRSTP